MLTCTIISGLLILPASAAPASSSDTIAPLGVTRSLNRPTAVNGVEPYSEWWISGHSKITTDLSSLPALAYSLTFSDRTTFGKLPAGYDPKELLEWGKYPGLNMDILHKHGFTGEGAVIAYVDQPIGSHEQYNTPKLHYTNNSGSQTSMHGPAVLSLLAGKDIGTAPEAEVYFYSHAAWNMDQSTHAKCLYQIIEQNKHLPKEKQITMVGFSDNIDPREKNVEAFRKAVAACEQAGIMVWFCNEYSSGSFLPLSDKNNYCNLVKDQWAGASSQIYVPASGRTTAATSDIGNYIYWSTGGLSWTMPYVLGLYAIALEINPALTQQTLRTLLNETAYNNNGMRIVNPVGFIAKVLTGVGRSTEAQAILAEAASRTKYLYAVMDTAAMDQTDLTAVGNYLASITDATVLVADAAAFSNAEALYKALQNDAKTRGGQTVGIQIFGTPAMVPTFNVQYKVQMSNAVDDGGSFLTDLFYSNFNNDPARISKGYNVLDHFAKSWSVDLEPDWPVARLPLEKGQFAAFFTKYDAFKTATSLERQTLVNFSNPIFSSRQSIDDMGTFLNRMKSSFGLLNTPYRLYGNQIGQYPVSTKVLGGFTAENLAKENDAGPMELLINSHGQWNNIDKCFFVNDKEMRESLINMDTINTVLDQNFYYLDCWTCLTGAGMGNNLTSTALNGKAVGVFSATAIISNNGVNCRASLDQMAKSNFYYFYYHYLKALHEGTTRSQAFFRAQQAYAQSLMADSRNGIRSGEGNYQFNLCNLLAYHNFGVLEPSAAPFSASGYITQAGQSIPKEQPAPNVQSSVPSIGNLPQTNGKPVGALKKLTWNTEVRTNQAVTPHSLTAQKLDNGYVRISLDITTPAPTPFYVFNPPNGSLFMLGGASTTGARQTITYDLPAKDIQGTAVVTMNFSLSDTENYFLFFSTASLK